MAINKIDQIIKIKSQALIGNQILNNKLDFSYQKILIIYKLALKKLLSNKIKLLMPSLKNGQNPSKY